MKKLIKMNKYLIIAFTLIISMSCIGITNVHATTIKIEKITTMSGINGRRDQKWKSDHGYVWCLNESKKPPYKNQKFNCSKASDGGILYILNKNGGTSDKEFLKTQVAIWYYEKGNLNWSPSYKAVQNSNSTIKSAVALAKEAKKNKSFTYNPSISIGKLTPTLGKVSGKYYYTTNKIAPSLTHITSDKYTVTASGASGVQVLNTSGKVTKTFKAGEKFMIRVPAETLTSNKTITVKLNATGTKKTYESCKDTSTYQNMALLITNKSAKATEAKTTFTVKPIGIKIKKVDADTNKVLSGAQYKIYSNSTCTTAVSGYTGTYTTGSTGIIEIKGLNAGTYYVKEIKAPTNYLLPSQNCLKVTAGGTVTFKNKKTVIKVYKVDQDNDKVFLANATYQIYSGTGCTTPVSGFTTPKKTDKNGVVEFIGLPEGTYSVKETAAPPGYAAPSISCQTVKTGGSVTFKNKKNTVVLYKQDQEGKNLPGATFGLYTNSTCTIRAKSAITGNYFDFANTNANGLVTFEGMASTTGYYYINEETPPTGYDALSKNENCKPVRVNGTVTFKNTKIAKNELVVQKRDKYTDFGINGVRIGLFSDATCQTKISEGVTSNGQVKFKVEYPDGTTPTYYVKEIETPKGYIPEKGKNECKSVQAGTDKPASTVIYNAPYGNIKLLKHDVKTDKPISGVEFALLDANQKQAIDINGNKVANQKTDENGNVEFKNVLYGTYYLKEVNNNGKYKLLKDSIKFVLNRNTDSIILASRGTVSYFLGDANSDGKIDNDDIAIYKNIVTNPDAGLGLPPEISFALDINGDGNNNPDDIRKDLEILQYYVKFANNTDNSTLAAAQNYSSYKNNYCEATGDSECNVSNLNIILDMYNNNKTKISEYNAAKQAATESSNGQSTYEQELNEYNTRCPNGTETTRTTTNTIDGDEPIVETITEPDPDCQNPPTLEDTTSDDICSEYTESIIGDVNGDCIVNNEDIAAIIGSNTDLNNDGIVNNIDVSILTRYVNYINSDNSTKIFETMNTFVNNKATLCTALEEENCSITDSYLTTSLLKVGKHGTIPSEIAKASLFVTNKVIDMKISKQSIANSKEIEGAKIVIRDQKGNKVLEYTSGKKPKEFKIAAGKYSLTEKVAPKGYKILTTIINFEVLNDGNIKLLGAKSNLYKIKTSSDGDNDHLVIYNELIEKPKIVRVPDTGSNIAKLSIVTGFILVIGGGYFVYRKII